MYRDQGLCLMLDNGHVDCGVFELFGLYNVVSDNSPDEGSFHP